MGYGRDGISVLVIDVAPNRSENAPTPFYRTFHNTYHGFWESRVCRQDVFGVAEFGAMHITLVFLTKIERIQNKSRGNILVVTYRWYMDFDMWT